MKTPKVPAPIPPATPPTQASFITRGNTTRIGVPIPPATLAPVTGNSSVRIGRPTLLGGSS